MVSTTSHRTTATDWNIKDNPALSNKTRTEGFDVLISWHSLCDLSESVAEEWQLAFLGTTQGDLMSPKVRANERATRRTGHTVSTCTIRQWR